MHKRIKRRRSRGFAGGWTLEAAEVVCAGGRHRADGGPGPDRAPGPELPGARRSDRESLAGALAACAQLAATQWRLAACAAPCKRRQYPSWQAHGRWSRLSLLAVAPFAPHGDQTAYVSAVNRPPNTRPVGTASPASSAPAIRIKTHGTLHFR
jgi:hypothetical protein